MAVEYSVPEEWHIFYIVGSAVISKAKEMERPVKEDPVSALLLGYWILSQVPVEDLCYFATFSI